MSKGDWTRYDAKAPVEACHRLDIQDLKLKSGDSIDMTYSVGESKLTRESVAIVWTRCHFGGRRPWWRCPGCGKQVRILYFRSSRFRCRNCHNLAYKSSQESKLDRHLRKKFKLCDKLGIGPIDMPLFKPKNMHQKTFDRLRMEHQKAEKQTVDDLVMLYKKFYPTKVFRGF